MPHVRESSWLWRDKSEIKLIIYMGMQSYCSGGAGVGRMGMVVG